MRIFTMAFLLASMLATSAIGQTIRGGGNPYSAQLSTDPDAGTVQGIQRYGRPMPTDPVQGSGYPVYVFPSVRNTTKSSPFGGNPTVRLSPNQQFQLTQHLKKIQSLNAEVASAQRALDTDKAKANGSEGEEEVKQESVKALNATQRAVAAIAGLDSGSPLNVKAVQMADSYSTLASIPASPVFNPGRGSIDDPAKIFIRHQPLVQIKLRVVEVARNNALNAGSTIDYISNLAGYASELGNTNIPGSPNLNNSQQNVTSVTRFPISGLVGAGGKNTLSNTSGSGALVNLTSGHINWIASFLAQEIQADVLTAPELVTTNGESVEFVAGTKSPFNLGTVQTNAKPGTDLAAGRIENNVFYKHVGTYVRITPRIVNYGSYGTGKAEKPIVAEEVHNWNLVIRFLINERLASKNSELTSRNPVPEDSKPHVWEPFAKEGVLVPLQVKTEVLDCLNRFTRSEFQNYWKQRVHPSNTDFDFNAIIAECPTDDCHWNPEECSIDLEVLARFSNKEFAPAVFDKTDQAGTNLTTAATAESGVRGIANIVQVKNGMGVVMAGLLGESDVETVSKIPLLGDLPAVGFLFRSKSVARNKSEIVIFIEANILSQDPTESRAQSSEDLQLGLPYVTGTTLDNSLELGIRRAGIGTYLPAQTHDEQNYWDRNHRRVSKIKTTIHDASR
jgi:Flp pilus assembly secretin CpaC